MNLQREWTQQILIEIEKFKNSSDPDIIIGNITSLRSLLKHFRKELFEENKTLDVGDYIMAHRNDKHPVQLSVIQTIPVLAAFNPSVFVTKHLRTSVLFLLDIAKTAKDSKIKSSCYFNLAKLIDLVDIKYLQDYLSDIMSALSYELERFNKPTCIEVIKCFQSLSSKFKKKILETANLNRYIDTILINGLHPQSLEVLTEISKMESNDTRSVETQLKLLYMIGYVLQGEIYQFKEKHLEHIPMKNVLEFQKRISDEPSIDKKEAAIAQALQALTNYDFSDVAKVLPMFFKDVVLEYLDHSNPAIRKAAAKAGCLLYNRANSLSNQDSIPKNTVSEILDKFLCIAFNDSEDDIRETMLNALNENFDEFLNHEKHLQMLFMCINDSVYSVKEKALTIIGKPYSTFWIFCSLTHLLLITSTPNTEKSLRYCAFP